MPEYLAPGVYLEEFEIGAKPIEGVSTSTLGILGETERGPVVPKLVTTFEDFRRMYGGYIPHSYLPNALEGFFANGGKRCYVGRVIGKDATTSSISFAVGGSIPKEIPREPRKKTAEKGEEKPAEKGADQGPTDQVKSPDPKQFVITATGPGEWGNRIALKIENAGLHARNPELYKIKVVYWTEAPTKIVDPTDLANEKKEEYRKPARIEIFDNISPQLDSPDNLRKKISGVSVLVDIKQMAAARPANLEFQFLSGGNNGKEITLEEYKGNTDQGEGHESGLLGFEQVNDISIVCAPKDMEGLNDALVAHCEKMNDRFAILQSKENDEGVETLIPPVDSKCAAFYYPWIKVMDPLSQALKLIPPCGHIAGVYARSDTQRGVHKAPANEPLRGAVELQFRISKGKQDVLNPRGVNCIRVFPGRGIRIWGARTVSSDPIWKYINIRRLFLYVGESIEQGTQWVVFEPSNERLWDRVRQTVTQFLDGVWRSGALMGNSQAEAFFVRCDRSTMTQDDIDNGRLVCIIGIASTKPAEFIILRIAQWQGGSAATE
jgi:phage tail sheath protein FI